MTSDQSDEQNERILSHQELEQRVKEDYIPVEPDDGRWFRCQRDVDGKTCNQLVFFPTGVRAHENHHSIKAGNGPLVDLDRVGDSQSEGPEPEGPPSGGKDGGVVGVIESELSDL